MVWLIGAICMIFSALRAVAIGLLLPDVGNMRYWGEYWSWLVYFCWCPFGDPGKHAASPLGGWVLSGTIVLRGRSGPFSLFLRCRLLGPTRISQHVRFSAACRG